MGQVEQSSINNYTNNLNLKVANNGVQQSKEPLRISPKDLLEELRNLLKQDNNGNKARQYLAKNNITNRQVAEAAKEIYGDGREEKFLEKLFPQEGFGARFDTVNNIRKNLEDKSLKENFSDFLKENTEQTTVAKDTQTTRIQEIHTRGGSLDIINLNKHIASPYPTPEEVDFDDPNKLSEAILNFINRTKETNHIGVRSLEDFEAAKINNANKQHDMTSLRQFLKGATNSQIAAAIHKMPYLKRKTIIKSIFPENIFGGKSKEIIDLEENFSASSGTEKVFEGISSGLSNMGKRVTSVVSNSPRRFSGNSASEKTKNSSSKTDNIEANIKHYDREESYSSSFMKAAINDLEKTKLTKKMEPKLHEEIEEEMYSAEITDPLLHMITINNNANTVATEFKSMTNKAAYIKDIADVGSSERCLGLLATINDQFTAKDIANILYKEFGEEETINILETMAKKLIKLGSSKFGISSMVTLASGVIDNIANNLKELVKINSGSFTFKIPLALSSEEKAIIDKSLEEGLEPPLFEKIDGKYYRLTLDKDKDKDEIEEETNMLIAKNRVDEVMIHIKSPSSIEIDPSNISKDDLVLIGNTLNDLVAANREETALEQLEILETKLSKSDYTFILDAFLKRATGSEFDSKSLYELIPPNLGAAIKNNTISDANIENIKKNLASQIVTYQFAIREELNGKEFTYTMMKEEYKSANPETKATILYTYDKESHTFNYVDGFLDRLAALDNPNIDKESLAQKYKESISQTYNMIDFIIKNTEIYNNLVKKHTYENSNKNQEIFRTSLNKLLELSENNITDKDLFEIENLKVQLHNMDCNNDPDSQMLKDDLLSLIEQIQILYKRGDKEGAQRLFKDKLAKIFEKNKDFFDSIDINTPNYTYQNINFNNLIQIKTILSNTDEIITAVKEDKTITKKMEVIFLKLNTTVTEIVKQIIAERSKSLDNIENILSSITELDNKLLAIRQEKNKENRAEENNKLEELLFEDHSQINKELTNARDEVNYATQNINKLKEEGTLSLEINLLLESLEKWKIIVAQLFPELFTKKETDTV